MPTDRRGLSRWLTPSLADCLLAASLLWMLAFTYSGTGGLLDDVNTGLHIRTGEYILDTGSVPHKDRFSYAKPGGEWFAWEWLADVLFALAFRALGLNGVAVLSAAVLVLSLWTCLRHMMERGATALAAVVVLHVGIAVSSVHYLARPHIFTLALLAVSWRLLDRDRRDPSRAVWWLAPLVSVWANLHGGFAGLILLLVILAAGSALESLAGGEPSRIRRRAALRYLALAASCGAASLLNPYGARLYQHMARFLNAAWVRELVQDFQPPRFAAEGGLYLEFLLFAAVGAAVAAIANRDFATGLALAAWAHASLLSVRHFGILFLVAAPFLAAHVTTLIRWIERSGPAGILARLSEDYTTSLSRSSIAVPLLILTAAFTQLGWPGEVNFPAQRAPIGIVDRNQELLATSRPFTLDSWADYLIYRSFPTQRVFFDGRADYGGHELAQEYLRILNGGPGWEQSLRKHKIDTALVPTGSSISTLLSQDPDWTTVDRSPGVTLFRRKSS